MCVSSECESDEEHSTGTDHTRSYDTKILYSCMHFTALKQSGR